MKSAGSVRSIPGTPTNGMAHHVKVCVEDISPSTVVLNHGTSNLKSDNTSEKIGIDIVNSTFTIKSEKRQRFHFKIDYQK